MEGSNQIRISYLPFFESVTVNYFKSVSSLKVDSILYSSLIKDFFKFYFFFSAFALPFPPLLKRIFSKPSTGDSIKSVRQVASITDRNISVMTV